MSESCEAYIEFDIGCWFGCRLEEGHPGRHRYVSFDDEAEFRPRYTVEWDQTPATVAGEVLGEDPAARWAVDIKPPTVAEWNKHFGRVIDGLVLGE